MKNKIFEWDDEKARANLRKHGVPFEEAATAFSEIALSSLLHLSGSGCSPSLVEWSASPMTGASHSVAFTYRDDETIRIISARRANRRESKESMTRKSEAIDDDDPLDHEIDFSNARPNPFARDYGRNRNLRILGPDLLEAFPDSESVNEALRAFLQVEAAIPLKRSARTAVAPKPKAKKKVRA